MCLIFLKIYVIFIKSLDKCGRNLIMNIVQFDRGDLIEHSCNFQRGDFKEKP